ncbi:MAG: 16S rRNA (guanine(966)-N(2))-methyltransferase, partial [uncultured Nocardioidaceae bacterium]
DPDHRRHGRRPAVEDAPGSADAPHLGPGPRGAVQRGGVPAGVVRRAAPPRPVRRLWRGRPRGGLPGGRLGDAGREGPPRRCPGQGQRPLARAHERRRGQCLGGPAPAAGRATRDGVRRGLPRPAVRDAGGRGRRRTPRAHRPRLAGRGGARRRGAVLAHRPGGVAGRLPSRPGPGLRGDGPALRHLGGATAGTAAVRSRAPPRQSTRQSTRPSTCAGAL